MTDPAASCPIRVVLVDDDPLVRAGLSMILGGTPQLRIVGEAADGMEGMEVIERECPDVVLMDIRMPRQDGLETTRRLLADRTAQDDDCARVIMLTTFDTDDMVVQALRAGAKGFLLKDTPPAEIVRAVQSVAAGEPMLSPSATAALISHVAAAEPTPESDSRAQRASALVAGLTERERDVALAIGRGCSNQQIAGALYMSVATVKAHVSHILTKLDAENRVQVAIIVHDAGLV